MHPLVSYIYFVPYSAVTYGLLHSPLWNTHVHMDITYIYVHITHTQTCSNYSARTWGKVRKVHQKSPSVCQFSMTCLIILMLATDFYFLMMREMN